MKRRAIDEAPRRGRRGRARTALALVGWLSIAGAAPAPRCPDGADGADGTVPAYGPVDAPPAIATWAGLAELPAACLTSLDAPAPMVLALAGRFRHDGSTAELAARLGAISSTVGLPYWSVTDGRWKPLVSDAAALEDPDAADERADFDAAEVLGGEPLHFAQNDTRSWGTNVYRMRALDASPDRLVVETDNVSAVKLGPVTLFAPHAVVSVHFIGREAGSTWTYYGLSVIRDGAFEPREKSLVNRAVALYRHLIGQAPDGAPPLAP